MAMLAVEAGVDMVTIFPVSGGHGMKPTDLELAAYYDEVLSAIRHPIALAVNPIVGYTPKATLIADLCKRYRQIESVILVGMSDSYFIQLKGMVSRDLDYYAPFNNSLNWFNLGAAGIYATEANLLPKTYRRYMNLYEQGNLAEVTAAREVGEDQFAARTFFRYFYEPNAHQVEAVGDIALATDDLSRTEPH